MRSTAALPAGAVRPAALDALFDADGPFLSVYLDVKGDIEHAARHNALRWRELREAGTVAGAPGAVLASIDELIPSAHFRGLALGCVANEQGILHLEYFERPVRREFARWAVLPSVAPLVEMVQDRVRYVVAVADRRGTDVIVMEGADAVARATIAEDDFPIRKVKPGGWSQRRFQRRAEDSWRDEAHHVAAYLGHLLDQHDPRLVLLAGDLRIVELVQAAIPERVAERIRVLDVGTRHADGSEEERVEAVTHMVATAVAEDTVAFLERFQQERGPHDLAVDGAAATLDALAHSQVETLLVHDDPADTRTAWFGTARAQVAADAETLRSVGDGPLQEGRLADVALRAAFGTGASVRIVPRNGPVRAAIGGLLRWPGTAPPGPAPPSRSGGGEAPPVMRPPL